VARTFGNAGLGPRARLRQGNHAVLPAHLADDFLRFCQRNPRSWPLLGIIELGVSRIPERGQNLDLRTDLTHHRTWRDGELVEEPSDLLALWRDDLVAFAVGCSFTFEPALAIRPIQITSSFSDIDGAPVHLGASARDRDHGSGASGLRRHHRGGRGGNTDVLGLRRDPQAVIRETPPEFAITRAPGAMLVTDLPNSRRAPL
jgi:uncharacterized protein YcsI (UPF0317 family)